MTTAKPAAIAAVLLTCSLTACGGSGSTSRPASSSSAATTTNAGPSAASDSIQPLSKTDIAWLDTYDRLVENAINRLGQARRPPTPPPPC